MANLVKKVQDEEKSIAAMRAEIEVRESKLKQLKADAITQLVERSPLGKASLENVQLFSDALKRHGIEKSLKLLA